MAASYGSCCDLALEIVGPVGPTQLVWQGRPLPRRAWRRAMKVSAITLDIPQLEVADAARLRQLWMEDKGTAPPRTFTARLMRLALAWDAQEPREGREPAKTRQEWNRIIKRRGGGATNSPAKTPPNPIASDGTRILKNWGGTAHEVLVTEDGASWNGQTYSSLSAVARAMTGTNRNGPKFFGLRESAKS